MKRQIRFREFLANQIFYKSPSKTYAQKSRGLNESVSYRFQTDDNGYIVSGRTFEGIKKICIIGASFVESKFITESLRWNTYLEKLFLQTNLAVKCFNAGYSGATSLNILNTFANKIINNNFDSIIYVISSNDYSAMAYKDSYWNLTNNHSNLYMDGYNNEDTCNYDELHTAHFESLICSIYSMAKLFNQELFFATYPNLSNERAINVVNDLLRKVCKDNNYAFIDIDNIMKSSGINYEENFYDRRHLNESGSKIFSKIIYEFYIDKLQASKQSQIKFLRRNILMEELCLYGTQSNKVFAELCNNDVAKTTFFSFIFSIDNRKTESNTTFLVKLEFKDKDSVKNVHNLLYKEDLGWYFFISAPKGKTIENSYHFHVNYTGQVSMSIENRTTASKAVINSIFFESIQ